jgi:hypothetical protein
MSRVFYNFDTRPGGHSAKNVHRSGAPYPHQASGETSMLRLTTWVSATCDTCGLDAYSDEEECSYFPDEQSARTALENAGWLVLAGGELVCSTCRAVRQCETYGHIWPVWRVRPVVDPTQPGGFGRAEVRYCYRCALRATRPLVGQVAA